VGGVGGKCLAFFDAGCLAVQTGGVCVLLLLLLRVMRGAETTSLPARTVVTRR